LPSRPAPHPPQRLSGGPCSSVRHRVLPPPGSWFLVPGPLLPLARARLPARAARADGHMGRWEARRLFLRIRWAHPQAFEDVRGRETHCGASSVCSEQGDGRMQHRFFARPGSRFAQDNTAQGLSGFARVLARPERFPGVPGRSQRFRFVPVGAVPCRFVPSRGDWRHGGSPRPLAAGACGFRLQPEPGPRSGRWGRSSSAGWSPGYRGRAGWG